MPGAFSVRTPDEEAFYAAVGDRLIRYALAADGCMRKQDALSMPCDVQFACADPARALLYLVCSNGGVGRRGDRHWLVLVRVEGPMRLAAAPVALPHRPIHVALDATKCRLLVAYNLPAGVSVHALDEAGRVVGDAVASFDGPHLVGWFPHQVLPVPGSSEFLLTCRGDDAVGEQAENPGSLRVLKLESGQLQTVQVVAPQDGLGFGPRNCAFHPASPWLYAVLERQNALAFFHVQGGRISATPVCTVGMLQDPQHICRPQLAGALALHPNGRFAYAINRSHAVRPDGPHIVWAGGENSVVVFQLTEGTGEPVLTQRTPLEGLHARCMALAHGGRLLVAAIRQSSMRRTASGIESCPAGFSIFRIGDDGRLETLRHVPEEVGPAQIFWAGSGTEQGR